MVQTAPVPSSPRAVVQAAITALEARQWEAVPPLVDPAELERFRRKWLWWSRSMESERTRQAAGETAVHYVNPDLPPAVVDYYERLSEEQAAREPGATFAGVRSIAELERLSASEMLAQFLEAHAQRYVDVPGPGDPPTARAAPPQFREVRRIIGELPEGDSLVHVLYRHRLEVNGKSEGPEVVVAATTRRTPQGWRLLLNSELFSVADAGPDVSESELEHGAGGGTG
jgi:hypothetical protein